MAGESAGAIARRQREKGERLIEKGERLLRSAERYERGAAGEVETARQLDVLRAQGWVLFHDIRWPGRPKANIDHVAIGPGGVFVIDSKNWTGSVTVRDGVLWHQGRRREEAVAGAAEAALAITGVLGNLPATPVLCFVRYEPLDGWAHDVAVCTTATLTAMLTSRPPVLHPTAVPRVAGQLSAWLAEAPAVPRVASASRRPSKRKGRSPARRLLGAVLGLALLMAFALGVSHVLPVVAGLHSGQGAQLGSPQFVKAQGTQPPLTITAIEVARSTVEPRVFRVPRGQRLVAVDLRIRNQGDRAWRLSSPDTSVRVDANGSHYPAAVVRRPPPGVLPHDALVRPHQELVGRLLFAIPKNARVDDVRMQVGTDPHELTWQVPAE